MQSYNNFNVYQSINPLLQNFLKKKLHILIFCIKKVVPLTNPSGINKTAFDNLIIYPNPTKDELFINSESQITKVEIYSLTGALLLLENNFKEKISVSALSQGVYMVKVYTNEGLVVSKVIKE